MIIYKDILSGDEMFSDAFEFEENFQGGAFYKLRPEMVAVDNSIDNSAFAFNPSAEEEEENVENTEEKKWDVVNASKLSPAPGWNSAADFRGGYFKKYCKAVYDKLEGLGRKDDAQEWMKSATAGFKFLKKDFAGFEMFAGENWLSCEGVASMGYLNWENNGQDEQPYILFFKHAIVKEKC